MGENKVRVQGMLLSYSLHFLVYLKLSQNKMFKNIGCLIESEYCMGHTYNKNTHCLSEIQIKLSVLYFIQHPWCRRNLCNLPVEWRLWYIANGMFRAQQKNKGLAELFILS